MLEARHYTYNLLKAYTSKEYDSLCGRITTQFIVSTMVIDEIALFQMLFFILDLEYQDLILGNA